MNFFYWLILRHKISHLALLNCGFRPQIVQKLLRIDLDNLFNCRFLSDKLEKTSDQSYTKEINVKDLTMGRYFVRIIVGEKVLVKGFIRGE